MVATIDDETCIFDLLFRFTKANFQPLSKGQPHSFDVNQCVILTIFRVLRNEFITPAEGLVGFELEFFRLPNNTLNH